MIIKRLFKKVDIPTTEVAFEGKVLFYRNEKGNFESIPTHEIAKIIDG